MAGGEQQVDVAQGEGAGAVGEVEVAELDVERPVGHRAAAGRLGGRGEHAAQAQHRAEALLEVGQVAGEHVDAADEHRGDQEQRDQPGGGQVAGRGPARRRRTPTAASAPCRSPPLRRVMLTSTASTASRVRWTTEARWALRRRTWAWPSDVRRSSRAATPSSVEAAWSVQAASSSTLLCATCGSRRRMTRKVARRGQREQEGRGPPRQAGDDPQRAGGEEGARGLPHAPAHQLADLPGVVVDAVEHLADGLLGELGERLRHRGVEQVGAQLALGAVADRGPDGLGDGVDDRAADHAQRQQRQQRLGGAVGQPAGDHRAEGRRRSAPTSDIEKQR